MNSQFLKLYWGLSGMEPAAEQLLQFKTFTVKDVYENSYAIVKSSPKTFLVISLTCILPLCVAILARSLFIIPLISFVPIRVLADPDSNWNSNWVTQLVLVEVLFPTFIFVFSLFSTGATVFTVASLYTCRPVSFSSTLRAIPRVFKRLFITFLFFSFFLILSNVAVLLFLILFCALIDLRYHEYLFLFSFCVFYFLIFSPCFAYITSLWQLASIISVMEPVYGLQAMKRSKTLLKGRTAMAMVFMMLYLGIGVEIEGALNVIGGVLVAGLCVVALLILNLVVLLVQSVFYFVCKNYHQEDVDKAALFELLGVYAGEYLPIRCSIEMQEV